MRTFPLETVQSNRFGLCASTAKVQTFWSKPRRDREKIETLMGSFPVAKTRCGKITAVISTDT